MDKRIHSTQKITNVKKNIKREKEKKVYKN